MPRRLPRSYAPRDITLLAYLLLSTAIFMTRALPLSALVLVLNVCNLTVCLALKGERVHAWVGEGRQLSAWHACDRARVVGALPLTAAL